VGIGETGLDYHRLPSKQTGSTPADDERYKQNRRSCSSSNCEVAVELGLNCVVHTRDSLGDTLIQMQPFVGPRARGVFTCFVDNPAAMQRVLAIGFAGQLHRHRHLQECQVVRETLAAVPADQFMLETDSPYLAPVPYRGKRCEPGYVKEISELVAQVRNCSLDQLERGDLRHRHEILPPSSLNFDGARVCDRSQTRSNVRILRGRQVFRAHPC